MIMNEKAVGIVMLVLVLGVGITSIIGMSSQTTGDASLARKQCCCEIDHYDYYGNPTGKEVSPPIRANNLDNCNLYCDRHFGHPTFRDITSAYPC